MNLGRYRVDSNALELAENYRLSCNRLRQYPYKSDSRRAYVNGLEVARFASANRGIWGERSS